MQQDTSQRLLGILAEDIKIALLQIQAVAAARQNDASDTITRLSKNSMKLIDNYQLAISSLAGQQSLLLEPVAASSVLADVAHDLSEFAEEHGSVIQLHIGGRYAPVMSNRELLSAALYSLGTVFAEKAERSVVLGINKTGSGITIGAYSDGDVSMHDLRAGRLLYGTSPQPLPSVSGHAAAGMFIADTIFGVLSTRLRTAKQSRLNGFGATLQLSAQLSLTV